MWACAIFSIKDQAFCRLVGGSCIDADVCRSAKTVRAIAIARKLIHAALRHAVALQPCTHSTAGIAIAHIIAVASTAIASTVAVVSVAAAVAILVAVRAITVFAAAAVVAATAVLIGIDAAIFAAVTATLIVITGALARPFVSALNGVAHWPANRAPGLVATHVVRQKLTR